MLYCAVLRCGARRAKRWFASGLLGPGVKASRRIREGVVSESGGEEGGWREGWWKERVGGRKGLVVQDFCAVGEMDGGWNGEVAFAQRAL